MNEQNKNEKKPVAQDATQKDVQTRTGGGKNDRGAKWKMALTKEKKFYLWTATACAVALVAMYLRSVSGTSRSILMHFCFKMAIFVS